MGNVVSSLVMYALQAAWFCQRLIDQDYRENHGSRSKPIMGIHETDLDVFLSKCRNYYLSKRSRHRPIKYGEEEPKIQLNNLNRVGNHPLEGSANSPRSKGADSLHFDYDNFLSRKDQRVSLSEPDFSRLIIAKNDLEYFLSKSLDFSKNHRECDSPKTERRKRKKVYYRKRYNPRGGDRSNEAIFPVPNVDNCEFFLTNEVDNTETGSSGVDAGRLVSRQINRKRLTVNIPLEHPSRSDVEEPPPPPDHSFLLLRGPKLNNFIPLASAVPPDLVLEVKNSDSDYFRPGCGVDIDRMDENLIKITMVRECLTGTGSSYDHF